MQKKLVGFIIAAALPCLILCQTTSKTIKREGNVKDNEAIKKVVEDLTEAWNKHDVAAYAKQFTADADFTSWGGRKAHGRDSIKADHTPFFNGMFRESIFTIIDSHIKFYGKNVATVDAEMDLNGAFDYDGINKLPTRKYFPLFLMTKDNGKWMIAVYHNVLLHSHDPKVLEKMKKIVQQ